MTDDKLGEIYDKHANDFYDVGYCFVGMQYEEFARAIKDCEAEKEKETCKWECTKMKFISDPQESSAIIEETFSTECNKEIVIRYCEDEKLKSCVCGKKIEIIK